MKTQLQALEELLEAVTNHWNNREQNRDYWQEEGYFLNDLKHDTEAIQQAIVTVRTGTNIFPQDLKLYAVGYGILWTAPAYAEITGRPAGWSVLGDSTRKTADD